MSIIAGWIQSQGNTEDIHASELFVCISESSIFVLRAYPLIVNFSRIYYSFSLQEKPMADTPELFICEICGRNFRSREGMNAHIEFVHGEGSLTPATLQSEPMNAPEPSTAPALEPIANPVEYTESANTAKPVKVMNPPKTRKPKLIKTDTIAAPKKMKLVPVQSHKHVPRKKIQKPALPKRAHPVVMRVELPVANKAVYCMTCGTKLISGGSYCHNCGAKIPIIV